MHRILFLTYEMIPFSENWGGCQRVHYLANSLAKDNEVFVIASKNLKEPSKKTEKEQLYHTCFFDNELHVKLFDKSNTCESGGVVKKKNYRPSTLMKINTWIDRTFFNEPNKCGTIVSHWIMCNSSNIISFIKRNNIDFFIVSLPPWSTANIRLIRQIKKLGIKVLVDYRDPWNCWNDKYGITFYRERKLLKMADVVSVTNENHKNRIINDFHISDDKIHVIMNGFDNDLWNSIDTNIVSKGNELLTFTYIGSISLAKKNSYIRNPYNFITAISRSHLRDRILFRVVGYYDENTYQEVSKLIPHFEMIPFVPQRDSLLEMCKADVCMNLHVVNDGSSRYLIAGKIFDYYRSGTAILSINGETSLERQFVLENHLGYYSNNEVQNLIQVIETIYSDWENNGHVLRPKKDWSIEYSRQYQNSVFCSIIEKA